MFLTIMQSPGTDCDQPLTSNPDSSSTLVHEPIGSRLNLSLELSASSSIMEVAPARLPMHHGLKAERVNAAHVNSSIIAQDGCTPGVLNLVLTEKPWAQNCLKTRM